MQAQDEDSLFQDCKYRECRTRVSPNEKKGMKGNSTQDAAPRDLLLPGRQSVAREQVRETLQTRVQAREKKIQQTESRAQLVQKPPVD